MLKYKGRKLNSLEFAVLVKKSVESIFCRLKCHSVSASNLINVSWKNIGS